MILSQSVDLDTMYDDGAARLVSARSPPANISSPSSSQESAGINNVVDYKDDDDDDTERNQRRS